MKAISPLIGVVDSLSELLNISFHFSCSNRILTTSLFPNIEANQSLARKRSGLKHKLASGCQFFFIGTGSRHKLKSDWQQLRKYLTSTFTFLHQDVIWYNGHLHFQLVQEMILMSCLRNVWCFEMKIKEGERPAFSHFLQRCTPGTRKTTCNCDLTCDSILEFHYTNLHMVNLPSVYKVL